MIFFSAALHAPVDNPRSIAFVVFAFLCLGITLLPLVIKRDMTFQRRCYWGGTAGTMVCIFLAGLPDWSGGLLFAAVVLFGMTLAAYFSSSYIKFGGRIYAFHAEDEQEPTNKVPQSSDPEHDPLPDQYGTGVSASRVWWLLVPVLALCSFTLITHLGHSSNKALLIGAVIAIVVIAFGYAMNDASWGYPVARGQYLQFVLISVLTAGAFTLIYLIAFAMFRRRPLRTRQSLERVVHPRFQEQKKK